MEHSHPDRRRLSRSQFVAAILFAVAAYWGMYRLLVDPVPYSAAGPAIQFAGSGRIEVIEVRPHYGWNHGLATFVFAPANRIDRWLRPRVWDAERAQPIIAFAF